MTMNDPAREPFTRSSSPTTEEHEYTPTESRPRGFYHRCVRSFTIIILSFLSFYLAIVWIVLPAVFYGIPSVRHQIVFMNSFDPFSIPNSKELAELGLPNVLQWTLQVDNNITIAVWSVPAEGATKVFENNRSAVIFCHGNAGSRAAPVRIEKYKALSQLNLDVIAFEYRGFADSTEVKPTVEGLVNDTMAVYREVRKHLSSDRIFIWGHSLGTGVGTIFLATFPEPVAGLVLETPFDNIGNVVVYHRWSFLLKPLPCFKKVYCDSLNEDPITNFDSLAAAQHINTSVPVLVMSAENDEVIDPLLAKNLYDKFASFRKSSELVDLIEFKGSYGHMFVHRSPEFPKAVKEFVQKCNNNSRKSD